MSFCEVLEHSNDGYICRVGDKFPAKYLLKNDNSIHKLLKNGELAKVQDDELLKKPWLKRAIISAIRYEARCGLYQNNQFFKHQVLGG